MISNANQPGRDIALHPKQSVKRLQLCASIVAVCAVWLVVLPWVAKLQPIEDRLQFLDERDIDPSAMFYTELDAMDRILRKLEQ